MLTKLKKTFLNRKFITFGLIGAFNTVLAQLLYILFVEMMQFSVGVASFFSDTVPMFFSYFLNMHFTYNEKPNLKSALAFPISYIPGTLINMVITMVVNALGVPKTYAKLFSLPITVPLNYVFMTLIVKKTKKSEEEK